jgi:hypothetical protein
VDLMPKGCYLKGTQLRRIALKELDFLDNFQKYFDPGLD